jgi:hypothetical protein
MTAPVNFAKYSKITVRFITIRPRALPIACSTTDILSDIFSKNQKNHIVINIKKKHSLACVMQFTDRARSYSPTAAEIPVCGGVFHYPYCHS